MHQNAATSRQTGEKDHLIERMNERSHATLGQMRTAKKSFAIASAIVFVELDRQVRVGTEHGRTKGKETPCLTFLEAPDAAELGQALAASATDAIGGRRQHDGGTVRAARVHEEGNMSRIRNDLNLRVDGPNFESEAGDLEDETTAGINGHEPIPLDDDMARFPDERGRLLAPPMSVENDAPAP
jgi:hypothetical protein